MRYTDSPYIPVLFCLFTSSETALKCYQRTKETKILKKAEDL